jgi:transglutaminase-like putative cysteine protease
MTQITKKKQTRITKKKQKTIQTTALAAIIIFSLLTACQNAKAGIYDAESIIADVNITSKIDIHKTSNAGSIEYITANLSFIPLQDATQKAVKITSTPEYTQKENNFIFRWDSPTTYDLGFKINTRMQTKNGIFQIKNKIPFPIDKTKLPKDIIKYTMPTDNIDSDNVQIIEQASETATGEDDLFIAVSKIAIWTKTNVQYNLSTVTAEVSQKASWVLTNRQGVCDEITSLFIAQLRTLGIPARFVSGVAYTNSPLFPQNWGAHGWAEVYFPGTGWVPFDVTYGELGLIDPTHIKFKIAADSNEPSTRYTWRGRDVEATADTITVSAALVESIGTTPDTVALKLEPLEKNVRFGSYNLMQAKITNLLDAYQTATITLSQIDQLETDEDTTRTIILPPKETRHAFWIVKVKEDLDPAYTYTFPVGAFTLKNSSSMTSFDAEHKANTFERALMQEIIDQYERENQKTYSKQVSTGCGQEKTHYYTYDTPKITCSARNSGNVYLRDLKICLEKQCRTESLGINQEKVFEFQQGSFDAGKKKLRFLVENDDITKAVFYDLDILDEPDIKIDDITFPPLVKYGTQYNLTFTIKKESMSTPEKTEVTLDTPAGSKTMHIPDLEKERDFVITLDSSDMSTKTNKFTIKTAYYDKNGREYTSEETFTMQLTDVTTTQRIAIFFKDIEKKARNLFKKS